MVFSSSAYLFCPFFRPQWNTQYGVSYGHVVYPSIHMCVPLSMYSFSAPAPWVVCFLCRQFYFGQCFGTKAINSICTHRARRTNSQKIAKKNLKREYGGRQMIEPRSTLKSFKEWDSPITCASN